MASPSNPISAAEPFASLPPFRIEPYFDPRIWGRKSLRPWFPVDSPLNPIGEVWLTGDSCLVATGPAAGQSLASLFDSSPRALLGHHLAIPAAQISPSSNSLASSNSPLLIKLLFAQQKLSVQVHPDDELARKQGFPRGKTECWCVLDAEPGAEVALGLKTALLPTLTRDELRRRALDGSLEDSLNLLPLTQGDTILCDAGTVHAIFPGSILLEVQENSDTTYRLFDYGRPRPLQIDQSLEALKFSTRAGKVPPRNLPDRTLLITTDYFTIESLTRSSPIKSDALHTIAPHGNSSASSAPALSYLFVKKGSALISPLPDGPQFEPIELPQHAILAIPAISPGFVLHPLSPVELLRIQALPL